MIDKAILKLTKWEGFIETTDNVNKTKSVLVSMLNMISVTFSASKKGKKTQDQKTIREYFKQKP